VKWPGLKKEIENDETEDDETKVNKYNSVTRKGIIVGFTKDEIIARLIAVKSIWLRKDSRYHSVDDVQYFKVSLVLFSERCNVNKLSFGRTLFWTQDYKISTKPLAYSYRLGKLQTQLAQKYRKEAIRGIVKNFLGSENPDD
jgi:hypothetical protein